MNQKQFEGKMLECSMYLFDFYCVVNAGSINKAALLCYKSVNGVSKSIKSLEKTLGTLLFDRRNNKAAELTEEGQVFYEYLISNQEFQAYLKNKIFENKSKHSDISDMNTLVLPEPTPCASCRWEDVADPVEDATLNFNFLPGGIPALMPDFVSLVYKFDIPVSLLPYNKIDVSLSFLRGDFNQVDIELHCIDQTGKIIILPPEHLLRQNLSQGPCNYSLDLKDKLNNLFLLKLKELCFVVPRSIMLKIPNKTGSFRVNSIDFIKE